MASRLLIQTRTPEGPTKSTDPTPQQPQKKVGSTVRRLFDSLRIAAIQRTRREQLELAQRSVGPTASADSSQRRCVQQLVTFSLDGTAAS
jgi:hypothetical protein